jgi:hypothetical protein
VCHPLKTYSIGDDGGKRGRGGEKKEDTVIFCKIFTEKNF